MSKGIAAIAGAALLLGLGFADAQRDTVTAAPSCDRACLDKLMDDYRAALLARDWKRLPLAPNVKVTENTNKVALGDGLWGTITSLRDDFKIYIADPQTEQIMGYGIGTENGVPMLYGVRLKEAAGKLTEIETFVARAGNGSRQNWLNLTLNDWDLGKLFGQTEPESTRLARGPLVHAVNQYFTGIVQGNGDIVPFDDTAIRIENGGQTAGPRAAADGRPASNDTVRQNLSSKAFNYIHEITQRRYPVVDLERQEVLAVVMFQHPGNVPSGCNPVTHEDCIPYGDPNIGPAPVSTASTAVPGAGGARGRGPQLPPLQRPRTGFAAFPNDTEIVEGFKLSNGKIMRIWAMILDMPYRQDPGWPVPPLPKS